MTPEHLTQRLSAYNDALNLANDDSLCREELIAAIAGLRDETRRQIRELERKCAAKKSA